ncbi:MAG TPA: PilZ domain-containing protein [Spirochaetia bacterium]|nr:PilZ domain-containing protein [Spirochaetia bacterium]
MTLLGTSVLQNLYQEYIDTELTYSKEVSQGLGMLPAESTVKWQGELFPCIVHTSSFRSAKILVRLTGAQWKPMELGSKIATLTMTFIQQRTGKKELFQFNGTLGVLQQHGAGEGELSILLGLTFSHRPPEGFLQAHGSYLNLKKEANQRREDRISLTNEARDLIGLASLNTTVTVDHIERKCLLRELSYNGARVILTGVAPFLLDKPFSLTVPMVGKAQLDIPGKIVRAEAVEGHRGLAVIALGYHPEKVPVEYLRALQKGFKLGLGAKRPDRAPAPKPMGPQTSTIDLRTLKVIRPH